MWLRRQDGSTSDGYRNLFSLKMQIGHGQNYLTERRVSTLETRVHVYHAHLLQQRNCLTLS